MFKHFLMNNLNSKDEFVDKNECELKMLIITMRLL